MLKKWYSKNKVYCRVTFEFPARPDAHMINLCGDFNEWNPSAYPLKRRKNGNFYIILTLKPGKQYRFRYLLNGQKWENDPAADDYLPNPYGSMDSVVKV